MARVSNTTFAPLEYVPLARSTRSGAVWLVMAKLMRYSSLAALVASVSSLIWVFVFGYTDAVLLCAALTALIYLRHAANIARLRQGTEPKIGAEKKAAATSGPDAP